MLTCSCGDDAEGSGTRCARCAALDVLELDAHATINQIKEAYRVLVKVWHPDRFQSDEKLKQAAEDKVKALNAAYVFLTTTKAGDRPARPRPRQTPPRAPRPEPVRKAARGWHPARSFALLVMLATLGCGVLVAVIFFKAIDSTLASQPVTGPIYTELRAEVMTAFRRTAGNMWSNAGDQLHDLIPHGASGADSQMAAAQASTQTDGLTDGQTDADAAGSTDAAGQGLHRREVGAAHPAKIRLLPYITVGLTQDEVTAIAGAPTSASADKLVYGGSELYFTDGKVSGWKIDPVSSPIRVKLWPNASVDPDLDSFGVGSSKNVVLVVQGTPTSFTENIFRYGSSEVYFQNDRVVSWKDDPGSVMLRTAR